MAKRRKKTSKRVPAKGRLRDMADKVWALAVKDDWGYTCAICRSQTDDLNSHHLIPRQHYALRYDLKNGICLCRRCHQFCPKLSPHQNAPGFVLWLSAHHPLIANWVRIQINNGYDFDGTRNASYFMGELQRMREYVETNDFDRIVGVRFSEYLDNLS